MELGLVLQVLKLSMEIFKNERGDLYHRLVKSFNKIEKEWSDELAKPDNEQSDLMLDRLYFDAEALAKLVIAESRGK